MERQGIFQPSKTKLCQIQLASCRQLEVPDSYCCHSCRSATAAVRGKSTPAETACAFQGFRRLHLVQTSDDDSDDSDMLATPKVQAVDFKRLKNRPVNYESEKGVTTMTNVTCDEAKYVMPFIVPALRPVLQEEIRWLSIHTSEEECRGVELLCNHESGKYQKVYCYRSVGRFSLSVC